MTRQPHDQFAKQYLEELLAPLGQIETSREVSPEVRQIDVWFVPAPQPATDPQVLGLLGQMAATASGERAVPQFPNARGSARLPEQVE